MCSSNTDSPEDGEQEINVTNLMSQPVEIILEILRKLPARKVLSLREVSKEAKAIIDVNEDWLAERIIERRNKELQTQYDAFAYASFDSFFDALRYWIKKKGMYLMNQMWQPIYFGTHYTRTAGHYTGLETLAKVFRYSRLIVELHCRLHPNAALVIQHDAFMLRGELHPDHGVVFPDEDFEFFTEACKRNIAEIELPAWLKAKQGPEPADDLERIIRGELMGADLVEPSLDWIWEQEPEGLPTPIRRADLYTILWNRTPELSQAEFDIFMQMYDVAAIAEGCYHVVANGDAADFSQRFDAVRTGTVGPLAKAAVLDNVYVW